MSVDLSVAAAAVAIAWSVGACTAMVVFVVFVMRAWARENPVSRRKAMKFGQALTALENGHMIARSG